MNKYVLSMDAETDGLWGKPFAIAAILYDKETGVEVDSFLARLDSYHVTNEWVRENVLPTLSDVLVTHATYIEMLHDFAAFYMKHKEAEVVVHMGYIVEAFLFRELHTHGFIGDWDAPYPLFDVSGNLQAAGENPCSVDVYAKKHNLSIKDYGTTHNPLYDCEVAAKVYLHLIK